MKVLVFGQTGQVAQSLVRHAPAGVEVVTVARGQADLTDAAAVADVIRAAGADAVINAAAYTAVDRAEQEPDLAMQINANAPGVMARVCADRGLPFLHLSTDYVFDGLGNAPFRPDNLPAPQNAYGHSKLDGEQQSLAAGGRSLILRTSWVFSSDGQNFVKTMLRLGRGRDVLSVVADQTGGPTPAAALADALFIAARALQDGAAGGVHHFAGTPDVSWADFARAIMAGANLSCRIVAIPTADYPTPARRPLNSRLDCTAFQAQFGVVRPDWKAGLQDVLRELGVTE